MSTSDDRPVLDAQAQHDGRRCVVRAIYQGPRGFRVVGRYCDADGTDMRDTHFVDDWANCRPVSAA